MFAAAAACPSHCSTPAPPATGKSHTWTATAATSHVSTHPVVTHPFKVSLLLYHLSSVVAPIWSALETDMHVRHSKPHFRIHSSTELLLCWRFVTCFGAYLSICPLLWWSCRLNARLTAATVLYSGTKSGKVMKPSRSLSASTARHQISPAQPNCHVLHCQDTLLCTSMAKQEGEKGKNLMLDGVQCSGLNRDSTTLLCTM